MRIIFIALLLFVATVFPAYAAEPTPFSSTISSSEIRAKYQAAATGGSKLRVLIMPGHEPAYGGAEYAGLRERDIAVDIATALAAELSADPRLEVAVARDKAAWSTALSEYFSDNWKAIQKFVKEKKRTMQKLVRSGAIEDRDFEVGHNTAAPDSAYRLYGISKWANEREYDIVIHAHLNDNVGSQFQSGFAVYVPDHQYGNAEASKALGTSIAYELNRLSASSTIPVENYGIVEDQDLIALGAFNTAEFASVLVEYAYIYESKITHPEARAVVIRDMAYQTYQGIERFLGAPRASETRALPYAWVPGPMPAGSSSSQTYALQVGLHRLGFYPPSGELLIGCPVSGYVGECTTRALKAFQKSVGLEETGAIGPRTATALKKAGL